MRAFLASVGVAIVVALGSMFALDLAWRPSDKAYTTTGARIDHQGGNLVGKDWTGQRF